MLGLRWPNRKVRRDCHFCNQRSSIERARVSDWVCQNPLCGQRNISNEEQLLASTSQTAEDHSIFSDRVPSGPVNNPFCQACEASLEASLKFRANYDIGDDDVAFRTYQWDVRAFERSHPLACAECEPRITKIISDKDAKMREKIWTEATLGKDSSDPDENRRLSAVEQIFSDHNLDYDLWIWRAGFATMMISQVTYPLAIFSSISHLWFATLVAHWLSRRWIPWWQYLRFRNEKISGGEDWTFTESTVFYVRLLTILSRTFSVPYALPTGLCVEAMARIYSFARLQYTIPAPVDFANNTIGSATEISVQTLLHDFTKYIMKYTPPELTVMEPMYVSQPEHAEVEEMDWEPEAPPTDEVTLASERLSMLSLPRTEEPTEELFRVAGPGLGFASDSVFAKKPSYKHSALASDDRSRSALPASFLRVLDMKVLRATYAICFLLRILFSVHVGTSRSVSATARLLADAATVAEVLSVVAWHIRSRTLPMRQKPSPQPTVQLLQTIHCLHLICRIAVPFLQPLLVLRDAAKKSGRLPYLSSGGQFFWMITDVAMWVLLAENLKL